MKVSTRGRYALRLMLDLAENGRGDYVSLKDISQRQGISMKYLEQIVTQLSNSGLIKSKRGPQGGYMLKKEPEQYSVGTVLRATEGSLAPISCVEAEDELCCRFDECLTFEFWRGLDKIISDYVDSFTLADLLDSFRTKKKSSNS